MGDAILLVAEVMKAIPERGLPRNLVNDVIDKHVRTKGPSGWRFPEGMNTNSFLEHLIHQGVLQPEPESMLKCPIPSFRRWLIAEAEKQREMFKSAQSEEPTTERAPPRKKSSPPKRRPQSRKKERGRDKGR